MNQFFSEIFPVEAGALPKLSAYRLLADLPDLAPIGATLAQSMTTAFGGVWLWADNRLLTSAQPNPAKLLMTFDSLKAPKTSPLHKVKGLEEDYQWQPSAAIVAEFCAWGLLETLRPRIDQALAATAMRVRSARIERDHRAYPWVVDGQPAISFSIRSRLVFDPDLPTYAGLFADPAQMIGTKVIDQQSRAQGTITGISGAIADFRAELLALTQRDWMRDLLKNAPKDELVVNVTMSSNRAYDYPASALRVPIALDDPRRHLVKSHRAPVELPQKPQARAQMVKVVADLVKAERFIGDAYSTRTKPDLFSIQDNPVEIVYGGNRTRAYDPQQLYSDFRTFGAYWWRERFQTEPLRIGLLNTFAAPTEDFIEAMKRAVERDFQFRLEVVRERKVRVISQSNLESAVRVLAKEPIDLVLAFFQDPTDQRDEDDADDDFIKAQTVGRGLPCLIVHESTFNDPNAMPGILMGILARAGNVPYLLDQPLPYADYVVGLDLIHERKRDGLYQTGIARVYRNDGALLYFSIATAPLQPDVGIPPEVLAYLLPEDYFREQRAVLHCNGRLDRAAMWALGGWEDQIGAAFYPVEIVQEGVPYLYALAGGKIAGSPAGTVFRLDTCDAFIVTTNAAEQVMPQPLHLHTSPPLTIEQGIDSVMRFTRLHYGAPHPPPLPVTVHNAEYIQQSIARGVMPDTTYGDLPFWL
jgi:hypothetical protein